MVLGIHCFYKINMITMELLKKESVNCYNKPLCIILTMQKNDKIMN